mgnify:CR=1 FL=1
MAVGGRHQGGDTAGPHLRDLGGLFASPQAPPLGDHRLMIAVTPHGDRSFARYYLWLSRLAVDCDSLGATLPVPEGKAVFLVEPPAVTGFGGLRLMRFAGWWIRQGW